MYSIYAHGQMITDRVRMAAYADALRRRVKPGAVVLDVGTGTGIFALVACQCGARRVFAVEPDDVIQVAKEIAADNGYAHRIEFIQGLSTSLDALPEKVDLIVSDLRGALPVYQHHIPSIIDARDRFLAPGGALIPLRDVLFAAVAAAPEIYQRHTEPWDENGYQLEMGKARRLVLNNRCSAQVSMDQLVTDPRPWATLDYPTIEGPDVQGSLTWTVKEPATADGYVLWFEGHLAEDLVISNRPDVSKTIYGGSYFPWSSPVDLETGDTITAKLRADLVGDRYIWRWGTTILNQKDPSRVKARFDQSTFHGQPLSPAQLQKRAASHVPLPNLDARIDRYVLGLMDGERSLEQIAHQLCKEFPAQFKEWRVAMGRVGKLSEQYGV